MKRLVMTMLLAAMMSRPAVAASDSYAGVKTIGIVSAIGTELQIGDEVSIPLDPSDRIRTDNWDIDKRVVAWTTQALSQRFSVQPVAYDARKVAACVVLEVCLPALIAANRLDAYVIVHYDRGFDWYRHDDFRGLGMDVLHGIIARKYGFFAAYQVSVYSVNGKRLDFGNPYLPGGYMASYFDADAQLWPKDPRAPTAAELAAVEEHIARLVQMTLPAALANAELAPPPAKYDMDTMKTWISGDKPIPFFVDGTAAK